jgi:TrmH RNA methyltransferase
MDRMSRQRPEGKRPRRERPAHADARPTRDASRRSGDDEQKFHGRHACHALFARRPDDVIRVYLLEERVREFGPLLKWCADQRRAYHIVEAENLERLAETVHHQGIVILARKRRTWGEDGFREAVAAGQVTGTLLFLDGVQNPHNLGSILRTSAHFGVTAILGSAEHLPGVTASAARVAEGGAEAVPLVRLRNPKETLQALKIAGYRLLAATSHPGGNVYAANIPDRSVVILGNEVVGVSPEIAALADGSLQIPGTGAVESLNVAVACGILLSEAARRRASSSVKSEQPAPPRHERSRRSQGKSRRAR